MAFQGRQCVGSALSSCAAHAPGIPVFVVDNASTDGTAEFVETRFPEVILLRQSRNRGFAGGCNVGLEAARKAGATWVMLLNQDARLTAGAVEKLSRHLEENPEVAGVQPRIMRPDGRCNSLGNPFHYLGFSVAGGNGLTEAEAEADPMLPWLRTADWQTGVAIPAVSGATVLLRLAALDKVGDFEEELFLYHEDFELSFRLRASGWGLHLVGDAVVIHDYAFLGNPRKWYFLERNRLWVLLAHLRPRTLVVLFLPLVGAEAAVLIVAWRQGWLREKLQTYTYWAKPGKLTYLLRKRAAFAHMRTIGDRDLLAMATVRFAPAEVESWANERILSPMSALLWRLLQPLI